MCVTTITSSTQFTTTNAIDAFVYGAEFNFYMFSSMFTLNRSAKLNEISVCM